jgi:hypothetical protein
VGLRLEAAVVVKWRMANIGDRISFVIYNNLLRKKCTKIADSLRLHLSAVAGIMMRPAV